MTGAARGNSLLGTLGPFLALCLALPAALPAAAQEAGEEPSQQASAQASAVAPLTEAEQRGKALYRTGESPSGGEVVAVLGAASVEVPAAAVPCVGCHGHEGEGRPEGGVTPSNITWEALTKPYGVTHESGREHPPYDERRLLQAFSLGVDPAGNELHVAMPRYRMNREDAGDLVAYLKRLGTERDPGVGPDRLRLGCLLPPPRLAAASEAVHAVLEAWAENANRRGGLFGRQVELRFLEGPEEPAARRKALERFLEEEGVFALIAPYMADAEAEIAAAVAAAEVPAVGPFAREPRVGFPLNPWIFYLQSGLEQQVRALVDFAAGEPDREVTRVAVLHAAGEELAGVAEAAAAQGRKQGRKGPWAAMAVAAFEPATFDPVALARAEQEAGTDAVLFLAGEAETRAFAHAAGAVGWTPRLLLVAALAGDAVYDAPAELTRAARVAAPSLAVDRTRRGMAAYQALAAVRTLPRRFPSIQLATLAAASVLSEALESTGRNLTRYRLVETLEGFYAFETGLVPPLSFGPSRRIGALGAYVATVDSENRTLQPAGGWVTPR